MSLLETIALESLSAAPNKLADWRQLLARSECNSVFLLPEWLEAWHATLGADRTMRFVLGYGKRELIIAGAFCVERKAIVFAGKGPSDYSGLLYAGSRPPDPRLLAAYFDSVSAALPAGRFFRLGRIAADGSLSQALRGNVGTYRCIPTTDTVAPKLSMHLANEVLRKKSLRRREKSLSRAGVVRVRTFSDAKCITARLPALFAQHRRRWTSVGKVSQFENPTEQAFFMRLPRALDEVNVLRMTEVACGEKVVAQHLGFFHNRVFTWYKPTFDIDFARYSPGELLLKSLIERAQLENAYTFDFTVGAETFKKRFADRYPRVHYVNITSSRWIGMALQARQFLRSQGVRPLSRNRVSNIDRDPERWSESIERDRA